MQSSSGPGEKSARIRNSVAIWIIALAAAILIGRNSILYLHFRGTSMKLPPVEWSYDDVDYDNLAFSIIHHGTFGFDWDDPAWRARYEAYNGAGYFNSVLHERHGFSPTTFKPPVVPFVFSLAYRLFGTGFVVARTVNLVFMSASVFLWVLFAGYLGGSFVAFLTTVFILIRPHLESFGATLMTESIATFLFTVGFLAFFFLLKRQLQERPGVNLGLSALSGVLFGLLALTRSLYYLWTPWIGLFALVFVLSRSKGVRRPLALSWTIVLASFAVVVIPWGIRNSVVSGHFNPLGSEGLTCLPGAYSDESYNAFGAFAYGPFDKAYKEFEAMEHPPVKAPAELAYLRGIYAKDVAVEWIRANWEKVPSLLLMRMYSQYMSPNLEVRGYDASWLHGLFVILFFFGCLGWWRRPLGKIFPVVFSLDCLGIALGYPANSRFIAPLIPMLAVGTAGIYFLAMDTGEDHILRSFTPRNILSACVALATKILSASKRLFLFAGTVLMLIFTLMHGIRRLLSGYKTGIVIIALTALVSVGYLVYATAENMRQNPSGFSYPPECACDDADYENIAFRLITDGHFGFDWSNPAWRVRYEAHNQDGHFSEYLKRTTAHITTYEPPLFPFAVSMVYRIFGTGFVAPRIMNLVIMCLVVVGSILFGGTEGGVLSAVIVALVLFSRNLFSPFSADYVTEPIATFLLFLFTVLLFRIAHRLSQNVSRPSYKLVIPAGVAFGLLILTRSIFVLWLPFIVMIPVLSAFFLRKERRRTSFRVYGVMVLTILAVVAPWWIRNCLVTYHFAPLGSQGTAALAGGYSDEALARGGNWDYTAFRRPYDEFESSFHGTVRSAPEREYFRGEYSKKVALQWAKDHWRDLPHLVMLRLQTHYEKAGYLMIPALLGLIGWLGVSGGWIFAVLLLADLFSIAITYEAEGRFMLPILPLIAIVASGIVFLPKTFRLFKEQAGTWRITAVLRALLDRIRNTFRGFRKGS